MKVLVTGGAGFIGSALVEALLNRTDNEVLVLDALRYSGTWSNLHGLDDTRLNRVTGDIADRDLVTGLLASFQPDAVINLAAETHVDRSIDGPAQFVATNVVGTFALLDETLKWWATIPAPRRAAFRFIQVSTDEVFGALGPAGRFDLDSAYDPRSPYSATKAAGDHLVRAWGHTYGLPVIVTHCSNNYGPRQYPEKLIPRLIHRAVAGQSLPVYGDGTNVRDWLAVEDHAAGLVAVLERGRAQATYMFGGGAERSNLQVAGALCAILDRLRPGSVRHADLIVMVEDRPGHDWRYAVDFSETTRELGFLPTTGFEQGLERTVAWYLDRIVRDAVPVATERLGLRSAGGEA